jgi:hypothetical protein
VFLERVAAKLKNTLFGNKALFIFKQDVFCSVFPTGAFFVSATTPTVHEEDFMYKHVIDPVSLELIQNRVEGPAFAAARRAHSRTNEDDVDFKLPPKSPQAVLNGEVAAIMAAKPGRPSRLVARKIAASGCEDKEEAAPSLVIRCPNWQRGGHANSRSAKWAFGL